jgi:choice-of-anchor B domain-containing protein
LAESGRAVPRFIIVVLVLMLAGGGALAMTAGASNPGAGTLSTDASQRTVGWQGQQYTLGQSKSDAVCSVPANEVCDHYELNVNIDAGHWQENSGGVEVMISWPDEADDFDLFVYDSAGNLVGSAENGGTSSERVFIDDASGTYDVRVTPWGVTQSDYRGGARVESRPDEDGAPVGGELPTEPLSGVACEGGLAGPFPCDAIDLESYLPRTSLTMEGDEPAELNDIWGWTDPATGRDYALVGKTSGTSFVDVTDDRAPVYLGDLPSHQPVETIFNVWRDIKVYKNHAYIGSEEPAHGLQVFDLTQLRGKTAPQQWSETAHYSFQVGGVAEVASIDPTRLVTGDNSHNIAINEESGFLYAVGTSTCGGGGPHVVNIQDPARPQFAGCVSEDGYTHDTQCVNYREGDPDPDFAGREICFNANEDTLTIVDVTDKQNPVQLARMPYDTAAYTHQGWLTEDRTRFLLDDELDEQEGGEPRTKTYVIDVENLRNPALVNAHAGESESIDHNQYVKGDRTFQSNYRSGLRVLDVSQAGAGTLDEVGFFDVYPADDEPEFNGTWSNYPYFADGKVIVSGIEQGLFVVCTERDRPTCGP